MSEKQLLKEFPARSGYATDVAGGLSPGGAAGLPAPEPSDDAVIERVLNGDVDAFEVLVRRYDRWVFAIVTKHVAREQVAEIAQEVFIHAYQSLPHYHTNTSFRQWLAKIAVRRCCDYWRTVNRHPTRAISNLNLQDIEQVERACQANACEAVQSEMELDKMREMLCHAIDWLEADDWTMLWLLYWQGYSLWDIAAILGYSPGNVKVRVSRSRTLLRKLMNSSVGDEDLIASFAPSMCRASRSVLHA